MATFQGPGIRVLKQYEGQDGKTYVQLSTGETLATDSSDYEDYYAQGILYGEDERGNYYPQEGAHDLLKQYQQLTQQSSFENYMKPYFEDEMTGSIARGLGQSSDKFWEVNPSYKQQYDEQIKQQLIGQFLQQNPANNDGDTPEARGAYLNRLTKGLPEGLSEYIVESGNAGVQPSYWSDFNRGAYTVGNEILPEWLGGGDRGLIQSIQNDTSLTNVEQNRKQYQIETGQYGFAERSMDQLGLLAPLAVPAKMVQSAYRDDYSFEDALSGTKNDANLTEDIITDPLTYAGLGLVDNIGKLPKAADIVADINRYGAENLPNAYKVNPFAFRTNSNNFYRQVDADTFNELEQTMGLIKGQQNVGAIDEAGAIAKSFGDDAYYNKGSLYYKNNRPEYLYEARKGEEAFTPKVNGRTGKYTPENTDVRVSKRPLDIYDENVKVYQKDWLQGYKPAAKPSSIEADLPGGMKLSRTPNKSSIRNPMTETTPEGEIMSYDEEIALKKYFEKGNKEPFYNFYADMPSSPIKAGKAYKMLDDFIPIGGKIKENSSLSWDSFKNVLKQSQQDKFNSYQDGFVGMNSMSKDPSRVRATFRNENEFEEYFSELNKQIEELGFDRAKLIEEEPLHKSFSPQQRAYFPNIVLEKKFQQGGVVLPDWLFQ